MKHFTQEQWDRYAKDELTHEELLTYETHLSSCDLCLELYMDSVERAAVLYPQLDDKSGFADTVMERVHSLPALVEQARTNRKLLRFSRHPVFHYTVAAAITLLLMSSGAFSSLTDRLGVLNIHTEAIESRQAQDEEHSSVSYKIMEKTIVMLDAIQPKREKGGAR
jgi:anti-sigma factor RsiW